MAPFVDAHSACAAGALQRIAALSEAGAALRLISSWPAMRCRHGDGTESAARGPLIEMATAPAEVIQFAAA